MVARKRTSAPTRIWSFHSEPPVAESRELVRDLLWKAHRYYNNLIAIERERVREYRDTREFYCPELVVLREAVEDARASTNDRESLVRTARVALSAAISQFEATHCAPARDAYEERKSGAPVALLEEIRKTKASVARIKEDRRETLATMKGAEEKRAARSEFNARLKELDERLKELGARKRQFAAPPRIAEKRNAEVLAAMLDEPEWSEAWKDLAKADADAHDRSIKARRECQLPPGCYLLVEAQAQAAIRDARPDIPRFRTAIPVYDAEGKAWPNHGRLGVQLTGNVSCADLRSGTTKAAYRSVDKNGNPGPSKKSGGCTFDVRAGSKGDRSPIMATFPTLIHRELPPSYQAKWAWVKVSKHAQTLRWQLQITLEGEALQWKPRCSTGSVELHCEVVPMPGKQGVRVATWKGSDGARGEIVVTSKMLRRLGQSPFLKSAVETRLNEAYRTLRVALASTGNWLTGWQRAKREACREIIKMIARSYAEVVLGSTRKQLWENWKRSRKRQHLDLYAGLPECSRWLRQNGITSQQERIAWYCEVWTRKDSHLRKMEADCRFHSIEARNQFFRSHGLTLRKQYARLETDTLSLVPDGQLTEAQRAVRQRAAPGECRSIIRECFGLPRAPGSRESPGAAKKSGGQKKQKSPKKPKSGTVRKGRVR